MIAEHEFEVAVVGCGPVGALLGNLLGKAGVRTVILEREASANPLPRAVHFDGECMRVFQSAGLADRMARVARAAPAGSRYMSVDGKTLLFRRGFEGAGPHGWAVSWHFHQPDLEQELRSGFERFACVEFKQRHEVLAVASDDDGARLTVQDLASGATQVFKAQYVIGCDGARSLVRRAIGSTMDDLGLHQPWLVVDIELDPASPRVKQLPEYCIQLCDPKRPMSIIPITGNRHRWEIMLMPGEDAARMAEPAVFWPMLSPWILPEDGRLERSAIYTFHSLIARGWRRGRLLLAGDSCHQTPPFLGQGMCAGIRDAANLTWKLVRVLRGVADPALLDTYEGERRPHVETFIRLAVKLGSIVQTTDPAVAAERDRSFAEEPEIFGFPQPQLGPGVRDEGAAPRGMVFPQPRMNDGRLLDEAAGGRFAVIGPSELLDVADAQAGGAWQRMNAVMIPDLGTELHAALAVYGATAVVLRPDAYVFGVAANAEELSMLSRSLVDRLKFRGERNG